MSNHAEILDLPPFPAAEGYAGLADRIARLLGTDDDVLLIQGEAMVALEAAAISLARPGLSALNIVTSPYGGLFGAWLQRGGATVRNLAAEPGRPISFNAVRDAWEGVRYDLVSLVHAESASGILNPLEAIAVLAKARGALVVVDAVASVGGHDLHVDALGIDIAVIGPQKALGGSPGLSALSVSPRAWETIARPDALRDSILSLADQKALWLDKGRGPLPGMPSSLEAWALHAALSRVESEGLSQVITRHTLASRASRAALSALGLSPWVSGEESSALITAARVPDHLTASEIVAAGGNGLSLGVGAVAQRIIRLNHTGPNANEAAVLSNISALGRALHKLGFAADTATALDVAAEIYARH